MRHRSERAYSLLALFLNNTNDLDLKESKLSFLADFQLQKSYISSTH